MKSSISINSKDNGLDGQFTLPVSSDDPLLLTDAGHRFEALTRVILGLEKRVADTADAKRRNNDVKYFERNPSKGP